MKKLFYCITILVLVSNLYPNGVHAQTKLLEIDHKKDTIPHTSGPNLKLYTHFFLGYGFVAGASEPGAKIKYGFSNDLSFGMRRKRKISALYSLGFDFFYHVTAFHLVQDSTKILPNGLLHDKEKFKFNMFSLGFYNRFNFDTKRGNYMGNFIDIGIAGDWNFLINAISKDQVKGGNLIKIRMSKLGYTNPMNYHLYTRIGFNRFIFTASYRMNDLFKPAYNFPELPRLTAGFEVGFY